MSAEQRTPITDALAIANKALDRPRADPDDDLATMARGVVLMHEYATRPMSSADQWAYFNWPNIVKEAKARMEEARLYGQAHGEKALFEYWCAWVAHANAVSVTAGENRSADYSTVWAEMERLLVEECGLRTDEGLSHQRTNLVNILRNNILHPAFLAAAADMIRDFGISSIRVNGEMMSRKQIAEALAQGKLKPWTVGDDGNR